MKGYAKESKKLIKKDGVKYYAIIRTHYDNKDKEIKKEIISYILKK